MSSNKLKPKIETKDKTLETYTDFKKRYYIYRVDDITEYIRSNNTELDKLFKQEHKLFNDLGKNLTPEKKKLLSIYSDNWVELLNEEIDNLTQYILKDFDEER